MIFKWNFLYHLKLTSDAAIFSHPETLRSFSFSREAFELMFEKFRRSWNYQVYLDWAQEVFANPEEFHHTLEAHRIVIPDVEFTRDIPMGAVNLEEHLSREELALGFNDFSRIKFTSVLRESNENGGEFVLTPSNVLRLSGAGTEGRFFKVMDLKTLRYELCCKIILEMGYRSVLDYGCGEGQLLSKLSEQKLGVEYSGFDQNLELVKKNQGIFGGNLFYSELPEKAYDLIILLEVLEHMGRESAETLVRDFLKESDVFLTMPNVDFNRHFPKGLLRRHPEHVHEWTEEEFQDFLNKLANEGYLVKREDIGRLVEQNRPTLTAHIRSYRGQKRPDQPRSQRP